MHYPGQETLVGDVPVTEVVAGTAIDAVTSTHGAYAAGAMLRTGGFVRPRYEDGALVLHVGHEDPTLLMPWEIAEPIPCCGWTTSRPPRHFRPATPAAVPATLWATSSGL